MHLGLRMFPIPEKDLPEQIKSRLLMSFKVHVEDRINGVSNRYLHVKCFH